MRTYDFIAVGSGPAGQRAAIQAAKLGAKAAIVSAVRLGGVCINTGTVPSKTLREAVIDLSGLRQRELYGLPPPPRPTIQQLLARARDVMQRERDVIRLQLERNGVDIYQGFGRFDGPHELIIEGDEEELIHGKHLLIAVGTVPSIPPNLDVDHETILTSDDLLCLPSLPKTLIITGAGVIGVEYASMFALLGVEVRLCDLRTSFLDMLDGEVRDLFRAQLEKLGVQFHLGETLASVETGGYHALNVKMQSGLTLHGDALLVSAGRQGDTAGLALEKAGLSADPRGRLAVDADYRTAVPHIYAAGDVIGAPQLASTSAEQGRHAACHAFGVASESVPALYPFGIYGIPEIGWIGQTEAALQAAAIPYETGLARFKEIARGNILGDEDGFLKLLVHRRSQAILGVWICGSHAAELVHIGQAAMTLGGTLDYFLRTVFNYPTLAEAYKVAALNCLNKLRAESAVRAALPKE